MKDRQRLEDIRTAIRAVQAYAVSNYETFLADEKTQDAIMYNLIIMGEAANQITDEFQEQHPTIPWSAIIGTRNVIVHGYNQVRLEIVWKIIERDLESLLNQVEAALKDS